MDVKTTFRNLVRDQSVSICMLQVSERQIQKEAGEGKYCRNIVLEKAEKHSIYKNIDPCVSDYQPFVVEPEPREP